MRSLQNRKEETVEENLTAVVAEKELRINWNNLEKDHEVILHLNAVIFIKLDLKQTRAAAWTMSD